MPAWKRDLIDGVLTHLVIVVCKSNVVAKHFLVRRIKTVLRDAISMKLQNKAISNRLNTIKGCTINLTTTLTNYFKLS